MFLLHLLRNLQGATITNKKKIANLISKWGYSNGHPFLHIVYTNCVNSSIELGR